jgi:DNA-directed RNA polymerase subunit M/transcription elongation factor TFIIS
MSTKSNNKLAKKKMTDNENTDTSSKKKTIKKVTINDPKSKKSDKSTTKKTKSSSKTTTKSSSKKVKDVVVEEQNKDIYEDNNNKNNENNDDGDGDSEEQKLIKQEAKYTIYRHTIPKDIRNTAMKKVSEFVANKQLIREIELGLCYFSNEYCENSRLNLIDESYSITIYLDKLNDIIKNLDYNSLINNHELVLNIINGTVNAFDVAYLSPQELFPSNWKKLIDKMEFIDYKSKNIATSDRFECKKCKERKVKITQLQTRSSDEPMTTFITCTVCGFTIKF